MSYTTRRKMVHAERIIKYEVEVHLMDDANAIALARKAIEEGVRWAQDHDVCSYWEDDGELTFEVVERP